PRLLQALWIPAYAGMTVGCPVVDRKETSEFTTTDFADNADESRKDDNRYAPAEVGLRKFARSERTKGTKGTKTTETTSI
ncbi:MAG: hypothetical protein U9Q79_04050, partial [Candidatus Hydrogenedentes bacterium]|nr:hypothetical protein [Candidatus Hydrogenedentota bacterium]